MKPCPGHYIFYAFYNSITALLKEHTSIKIKIKWVLGYKGVEGNEKADEQAKKVITEGSSDPDKLLKIFRKKLPYSKLAMPKAFGEKLKGRAQKAWMASQCYDRIKKTDLMIPMNKYLKLITLLPRKLASILSQLRTGHAPLAKHSHHIEKIDSPTCPACQQTDETIQHFMLHYPAHNAARQVLQNDMGGRDINITKLLTTPETLHTLFKYVADTGRWHNTFSKLPTLEEEQRGIG